MSSRLIAALFALSLMIAGPAFAQKTPAPAPASDQDASTDPAAIERAHRFVAAMIAQSNARSFFQDETNSDLPAVRHGRSGMLCVFDPEQSGNLTVYPAANGAAPGDDVSCNMMVGRAPFLQTFYATRYVNPGALQQRFDEAVGDMRDRYGTLTEWTGRPSEATTLTPEQIRTMPPLMTARYVVNEQGQRLFTRISMCKVGDWIVMLRFSTPVESADEGDNWASEIFSRVVLSVVAHGGGDAV